MITDNHVETDLWHWQSAQGRRWLTCSLLSRWPHAFFTRESYPKHPSQLAPLLGLPGEQAHWAHQVHGSTWIWAAAVRDPSGHAQQADALASKTPGTSVWVCTADCVPILMAGTRTTETGNHPWAVAIHAGWRGTAAAITTQVLEQLQLQRPDLNSIHIALGPAISGPVYQVGEEVAEQVIKTLPSGPYNDSVVLPDPQPGKVRLDLRQVNALQLAEQGVPGHQISICPYCTWGEPDLFFSYRRDGSLKNGGQGLQVQWSGIGLPLC
ncbi:MAG: peptidoglycan editing factor PgeF [Synechococcaceae cyanobacterium SM2_3_1]|nr:peptidoglycan editing factor PgeF [Synechococcaceae cyanobacterium SM2_3_1]